MQAVTPAPRRRDDSGARGRKLPKLLNLVAIAAIAALFLALLRAPHYDVHAGIPFKAIPQSGQGLTSSEARQRLASQLEVRSRATQGDRRAVWIEAALPDPANAELILFGDKQISSLEVWLVSKKGKLTWAGAYLRDKQVEPPFRRTANVVAIDIGGAAAASGTPVAVLARISVRASANITVGQARLSELASYEASQERIAATLAGGLGLLALFFMLVAQFSSTPLFRTFAYWLLSSVAVCAAFYEYDYLWFGQWAESALELQLKLMVVATYSLTTAQLFMHLFRRGLVRVRMLRTLRRLIVANAVVGGLSFVIPIQYFQPTFWLFAVGMIAVGFTAFARIMRSVSASTPGWYAAGWGVQLLAGLAEVLYASGLMARHDWMSFQTSVLVSALITGLAVADTLRMERARRHEARRAASRSSARYRMIYDTVAVGMATVDVEGRIVQANRELIEEVSALDSVPKGAPVALSAILGEELAQTLLRLASDEVITAQWTHVRASGERRIFSISAASDARGAAQGIELTFNDITASARLTETLTHLAAHDPLTGLSNRRGIEIAFEAAKARAATGEPVCVAYVDMDRFRLINEFYGHAVGDAILKQASDRMRTSCPPDTDLGRIGGDEFVVFLPGMHRHGAHAAVTGLLDRLLAQPYAVDGKELNVSASAGVVELDASMSLSDAIAFADRACATAKSKGKGMVIAYASGDTVIEEFRSHMSLGTAIRSHFPFDRLQIYAQPIVALDELQTRPCFEVLLRVGDEGGRAVQPPGRLIEIAEQQGMMSDLDRFVLRKSLEHMSANLSHTRRTRFVTINLSAQSVNDDRFVVDAIAMLREHEHIARHVMLEFTESVALRDIEATRKFVDQMRTYGTKVALDDFGAGYTSFNYLKSFPANIVKIDGTFIRDLNRHPANFAITRAITALCHELKIQVIAEWVEDVPTLLGLLELDVDFAQGYVFSAARPIEHWLTNSVDMAPLTEAHKTFVRQAAFRRRAPDAPRQST